MKSTENADTRWLKITKTKVGGKKKEVFFSKEQVWPQVSRMLLAR